MSTEVNTGNLVNLLRDAHYHPIRATQAWQDFVAAMQSVAKDPVTDRLAADAQRKRETTYARGELGGHGGR